ncbi:hypothetical protein BGZ93_011298 [Podila epicladia]|nr:hypothetical protein BGZ92_010246 [Podila epicladia]KAG0086823.1 hypothetical protein BGZ93_011298 [Podila epicladia]
MKELYSDVSVISVSTAETIEPSSSKNMNFSQEHLTHTFLPTKLNDPVTPTSEAEFPFTSYMEVDGLETLQTTSLSTAMDGPPPSSSSSSTASSAASLSGVEPLTPTSSSRQTMDEGDNKTAFSSEQSPKNEIGGEAKDDDTNEEEQDDMDQDPIEDDENVEQEPDHPYTSSSSSACSSSASLRLPSIITVHESIYYAVPISSELHIIPHCSRGFHWNEDLFLKPHQRRRLGVDAMQAKANSIGVDPRSSEEGLQHHDSAIVVHEVHLCEQDILGILPSWP